MGGIVTSRLVVFSGRCGFLFCLCVVRVCPSSSTACCLVRNLSSPSIDVAVGLADNFDHNSER